MKKYGYFLIIFIMILICKLNGEGYSNEIFEYIEKNDYRSLEEVLQKGADPNIYREGNLNTPLLMAVDKGNIDIVKLLIKYNADVECEGDILGIYITPFILSIYLNNAELISYFLNNFRLSLIGEQGGVALISCAVNNNFEIAKILIAKGAPVNYMTRYGQTPLIASIYKNDIDMVRLLLENGASVTMKIAIKEPHPNFDYLIKGQTPIEFAEEYASQKIIDLLKSYNNK